MTGSNHGVKVAGRAVQHSGLCHVHSYREDLWEGEAGARG